MKPRLLIIDDDEEIRTQMKWALADNYEVLLAEDREEALNHFKTSRPSATLLDLGLPPHPNDPTEGLETLAEILDIDDTAKVIIVSGQEEEDNAIHAIGVGAYDFLCKPVDMADVQLLVERCIYVRNLEREYREQHGHEEPDIFEGMIGGSAESQIIFEMIRKVSKSTAPVLILGGSGTGKEMAARAIHRRSGGEEETFAAINCSAIPANLLESELFGHEKGAFTGAHAQRKGLVESAMGGTLFLDEIGELSPALQVKLLRFLQEQRFKRVGGREEFSAETRVIAATNTNIQWAIDRGTFREDLYFRLAVVVLNLPPLRERGDDLMLLANSFLKKFSEKNGKSGLEFAPETERAIRRYAWPGNIRELENRIQRAVIMGETKRIKAEDLELPEFVTAPLPRKLKDARETIEREMVVRALEKTDGVVTLAADELGVSRPTLYELMQKLDIPRE